MGGDVRLARKARPRTDSGSVDSPAEPFLTSKLFIPPTRAILLDRPRLAARLDEGLGGPLTLIAAPPGWGKTTLLSAWAATPEAHSIGVAWVSLDAGDNDPARFWTYVILALRQAYPAVGEISLAMLRSPQPAPAETVLTSLLNELGAVTTDAVLVLDDYHAIDNAAIHHGLTFLVDRLPPRLHFCLATRADPPLPLARLRARGALLEVRAEDLRFTRSEAAGFFTDVIGLALTEEMVGALEERTEGWIAGLQLAALAMRDRRDLASFIDAFSGSHRFVADYLAEEVFQRQTTDIQDFLLRSSILERMCAPLCQALDEDSTATPDAQDQLDRLDRANLFVIPLDGERRWYRYHHLFADLLRAHLQRVRPDQVRTLHRRASAWFEHSGLFAEAIRHALSAGDFARAADLLEPAADPIWMRGEMATLRALLAQMPTDVLRGRPRLLVVHAWIQFLVLSHPSGPIEALLDEAETALGRGDAAPSEGTESAAPDSAQLTGRIIAIRASLSSWQHDTARTIALSLAALDRLVPDDLIWRAVALTDLGMAYALRGEVVEATHALSDAIHLSHAASGSYYTLGARMWLAQLHVIRGKLRDASELYRQLVDQAIQHGVDTLPIASNFFVGLGGSVDYEWNDLESAERHLLEGIRLAGPQQWPWVLLDAYASLARIRINRGEIDGVHHLLDRMEQHARNVDIPFPWMAPRVAASMAQAYLAFGQVDRAADWMARCDRTAANDVALTTEVQRIAAARLLVAQSRPHLALPQLDELVRRAEAHGRLGRVIEIQSLRSVVLEVLGKPADAMVGIGRALTLAEPEGYVRRFVDEGPSMKALLARALAQDIAPMYVAQLLRAFGEVAEPNPAPSVQARGMAATAAPRAPEQLDEPLSARERDVLRLLLAGRSGPQIAETLVVAPSTVKTHLKNIYDKLGVHSRDQAIARVRELKLLK